MRWGERMDPNPIKHLGSLMKEVRSQVEPLLVQAGFQFSSRNKPQSPCDARWLDYTRGSEVCSIRYNGQLAKITAELLDAKANCTILAAVTMDCPRNTQEIFDRIADFRLAVMQAVSRIR
jgi:hypothetical protein